MTRFSQRQYERQVLITMAVYSVVMLLAWPPLRATPHLSVKVLLALAPVVPMVYLIGLIAWRIRDSDELEQRAHLMALAAAAAITSVLGLIGGFLSVAGVLQLDGSVLMWVFPVILWSYGIARWYVLRRYSAGSWCDEAKSAWFYLRFAILGVVILAVATVYHDGLDGYRLGFVYGTGAGCMGAGLVLALKQWRRRRYRDE